MKNFTQLKWTSVIALLFLVYSPVMVNGMPEDSGERKLTEVLSEISERYQVIITYDAVMLEGIKVDIDEADLTGNFEKDFSMILDQTNLDYKYLGTKYYVIYKDTREGKRTMRKLKRKINQIQNIESSGKINLGRRQKQSRENAVNMLQSLEYLIQDINISGSVSDEEGNPLIGVNILIKGTNKGTATDFEGQFTLEDVDENAVLVVSYVGYQKQEVAVDRKSDLTIVLVSDSQLLDEVVVVGYGTQRKVNLTGSVDMVTSKRLENRPITSAGEGLQGLIPNLNITFRSGEPGTSPDFNIRGYESINGGSPLILVDGVAMDINLINPSDIESVTVLKDASASAIYGARASFGVILVTTKKGSKRKPTFRYDIEYSLSAPIINVEPLTNSYEFALIKNEVNVNGGGSPLYTDTQLAGMKAYSENPGSNPEWAIVNEEFQYYGNTNFKEMILKDVYPTQKHNLSINGGSDRLNYYISTGYLDKDGLYKIGDKDYYKRLNLLVKLDLKATDWLTFNFGGTFNNQKTDDPYDYGNDAHTINAIVRHYPTRPIQMPYHPDYAQFEGVYFVSPYAYFDQAGRIIANTDDLWLTTGTKIDITKHLRLKGDFSQNIYNRQRSTGAPKIRMLDEQLSLANPIKYDHTAADFVSDDIWNNRYYAFNVYGEYENNYEGGHYLKAMAGFNQEYKKLEWNYAKAFSLVDRNNPALNLTLGTRELNYSADHWSIRGAFYRVNYIFKDRYLLELSGRYDATSRFPKEDRFNFFPSFSAGWRVSEEGFMEGTHNFIDNLKIRASYGTLGNQLLGNNYYPYIAEMGFSQQLWIIDGSEKTPGVRPSGLVSPALTWETVTTKNLGFDLTILKQKLDFSFDYYIRETKDMLMQKTYPDILGTSAPKENAADLETTGWEAVVTWYDNIGSDFKYDIRFSLADATSEITKYDNPTGSLDEYYVGQQLGEIWGFETVGIFQNQEEIDNAPSQEKLGGNWSPGDIHFADIDGNDEVSLGDNTLDDHGDLVIIGNNTARYSFGINLDMSYKNWFAGMFFQGIGKQSLWPNSHRFLPFHANSGLFKHQLDYWREDNTDAYFYRPLNDDKNWWRQTRYIQDAAYIRLKNLTLGYNLPSEWTRNVFVDRAKVFFSGQNLWETSKLKKPLVPEERTFTQAYPFQRAYALGINFTF